MKKQFIIKTEFEQVISAESEEKATEIFYTEFNKLDLADLNLKINFKDRYKNMKKSEYENDLNDMIEYYKEGGYFHEVKNTQKNVIQMFNEKIEILICGKCMQRENFYSDNSGKVACKHFWDSLLEKYQKMKENGNL